MAPKRAMKVALPGHPLRSGMNELVELHLRIPEAAEVISSTAVFEGRCRSTFSGRDSMHLLTKEDVFVPLQPFLLPTPQGKLVLPTGSFRLPLHIRVPADLPGTFTAKCGAIAYRIIVKLTLRRFPSGEQAVLETEKPVDVLGFVENDVAHNLPVSIERHVRNKLLCFNRLDANVSIEIDRAAFIVGEHILVTGQVANQHSANFIKNVAIELRQRVTYSCGNSKRNDFRLITRLICGSVAPSETFELHHSIQIPQDCYPTLEKQENPIQVAYILLVTSPGHFEVEVPVSIGNRTCRSSNTSLEYPESLSEKSNIYYSIPPSEYSFASTKREGPPPYSTHPQSRPLFVPIHMLNTPFRPFERMWRDPPKYHEQPSSPCLRIEEIED